jgi:hypothetical protein
MRKATNIKWDTDGYVIEWLPLCVEIPETCTDEVVDYLSDEYGFCVESFDLEQTMPCNEIDICVLSGFLEDEEIVSNERLAEINTKYRTLCENATQDEIEDYYDNYEGYYPPFVGQALN